MASVIKTSGLSTLLLDPFQASHEHAEPAYLLPRNRWVWMGPMLIGLGLLLISVIGWVTAPEQFYFAYLVGWVFCLSLTLGALFFVMVHHITRAYWSVVVRRISEMLLWTFPILAILSIPFLIGMHDLYHWTHHEVYEVGSPEYDPVLAGKRAYLNVPFYLIRMAIYFFLWILISYKLYRLSILQDIDPDREIPAKLRKVSAWGIPVFAVTLAFASYDLLMSLDPHWFSTIFGVYFFSGAFLSAVALITLISIVIQRYGRGALDGVITMEHYHDLGKWMFAFVVFWAYIAFSQYMLIWYANLPEETLWFFHRAEHGWGSISVGLLFAHFILPFVILLPRGTKRNIPMLSIMAVWLLIMHWYDIFWLSLPVLREEAAFHWLDFTCWLGLFGLFVGLFFFRATRHSLIPQHDPYLGRSLRFENV